MPCYCSKRVKEMEVLRAKKFERGKLEREIKSHIECS